MADTWTLGVIAPPTGDQTTTPSELALMQKMLVDADVIPAQESTLAAILAATVPSTTLLAAPFTGQVKIAVTSTAVVLGSHTFSNGVIVKASSQNTASILIGPSGVTTTNDGTGNGYPLVPGEAISIAAANLSQIFINGTAGDFVSFIGN